MGTHPIFESDFDCLTDLCRIDSNPPWLRKDVDVPREPLLPSKRTRPTSSDTSQSSRDVERERPTTSPESVSVSRTRTSTTPLITNKDIVAQIAYARLQGDVIVTSAYAHELPRYGISVGLTNYSAAYATGLLIGRRVLQKFGLDSMYEGQIEVDGDEFYEEADAAEKASFRCYLDTGLARTSTGARIFGVLKGYADAGIDIPHSPKGFPGFADGKLNAEAHKDHIFGGHVGDYMEKL